MGKILECERGLTGRLGSPSSPDEDDLPTHTLPGSLSDRVAEDDGESIPLGICGVDEVDGYIHAAVRKIFSDRHHQRRLDSIIGDQRIRSKDKSQHKEGAQKKAIL